jgi:hypothetical protein
VVEVATDDGVQLDDDEEAVDVGGVFTFDVDDCCS